MNGTLFDNPSKSGKRLSDYYQSTFILLSRKTAAGASTDCR
jgi:hypothetical protein